ncbi:hypothetical protein HDV04_005714 [Boothiomyces sp. JEL0838]|nr:hypothetical protein HDV04_005714 [Boothiomyces sp. JEL0838]
MLSLLLSFAPSVFAYSLCNTQNYPYANQVVTDVPFYTPGTVTITVNNQTVPVTVSGSVSVVDGCHFATKDLSFTGPSFVKFVGRKATDTSGASAVLLSTSVVTSPSSQTYTFVSTAGNWVSYNDFDLIELFDPVSLAVIGIATLPPKNPATPTTISSTKAAVLVTSTANPAPASTTTSSTSSGAIAIGGGLVALVFLANVL